MNREARQECEACPAFRKNIFCGLSAALARRLSDSKTTRQYQRRQVLYYEGAPVQGVYCVQSGEVKIYKTGLEGKQHILRMMRGGDVLALEDVFYNKHYSSSAEMIDEGKVCFIAGDVFLDIIRAHPDTALTVMKALATEVVASEEERVDLAQNSVRERMARLLTVLSHSHGTPSAKGVQIHLPLSREEMAEMIGTASETAMRLLKEFRDDRLVEVEGRKILVLDEEKLRRAARIAL
jgi:CRP-like cAMP-binding protein